MATSFRAGMEDMLYNVALSEVVKRFSPVVDMIEEQKKSFGRELGSIGMDVSANPFPELSGDWKMLGDRWLARKKATAANPRFYRGISDQSESLQQALFAMPTEKLFGKTQLITRLYVWEANGFFNPRIRKKIETVFRNERGQFASAKEFKRKPVQVRIQPFPALKVEGDIFKHLPISDKQIMKLEKNDSLRPLVEAFTEHFFRHRIQTSINRFLGAM